MLRKKYTNLVRLAYGYVLGHEFQSEIEIEIGIGANTMGLGHKKLDVYRPSGMLSRLGGRDYSVEQSSVTYPTEPIAADPDSDFDFDPEDEKP